ITLTTERSFDDVEMDEEEEDVSEIIEKVDDVLNTTGSDDREEEWKDMIGAIDFLKTDKEINNALGQLLPSSYGYGAMATMDLHRMLSDFAVGGSLAPAHNVKEKGKWHNIAISYDSETDHIKNGTGYKNNHSGMVGAMERTLDDVTVGWHAALNHQSTNGAEIGRLKGDGLYLGAQVKYAPKAWNGWSTFGIARVGIEDFEMQRNFNFNGYNSKVDSDFTAFSGSLRVGGAYEKEAKEMTFGPFAALDYAFAHHPSIEEDGAGAGRLSVESGTYDSLRTQLGYRVQTAPKHFKNETYWQANAAIAWNHELLGDAGNVSASFRDFGGTTLGCDVDNYGRDSLSLMAGMTLKTPKKLDVTFNLGTDIYRHGGDTLYAKCALEWKF
ncbi:MAG: autotransporter outer membrane beta-barrel domain-containing protein, partial [Phascolarctobacterium sp.]|nr:autotransporter outer membrane beta-barrel domain-containing protein [Phascolarctobacterium sp.]